MTALRSTLVALPAEQRVKAIVLYLQEAVGSAVGLAPDAIATDVPFPDPAWLLRELHARALQDFDFPLYGSDAKWATSLCALAEHIARELDPEPPPPEAITDLYAEGQWAWGDVEPAMETERNPSAVFIVSAPRAGSTLLRVMLGRHPSLFAPPELHLLPFRSMQERLLKTESLGCGWMRRGLVSALVEAQGISPEAARRVISRMEEEDLPVVAAYAYLQEIVHGRLLVDKTPTYAFHPIWLRNSETLFLEPRYIYIVREPRASVESFVRMRFDQLLGRRWAVWDENRWRYAEKCWVATNLNIVGFLEDVPPSRQLRVRYEDLVEEPHRVAASVCEFMQIDYDPAMLLPYAHGASIRDWESNAAALGDPGFLRRAGIERGPARNITPTTQPLCEAAKRLTLSFGYR